MKKKEITLKIMKADMLLNFFLGFALTLIPGKVEEIVAVGEVLPIWIWTVVGVIFLLFAMWQTGVVKRQSITPSELKFAGGMALGPVVLLTIGLLAPLPLKNWARALLWSGNIYMFFLGIWYLKLSK